MGPFTALNSVIVNAFKFSGRAPRSEYWWFFLWDMAIGFVAVSIYIWGIFQAAAANTDFSELSRNAFDYLFVYWIVLSFFPRLAVTIRRLHDAGFSGFWYLLYFVPFGGIAVFIFTLLPSQADDTIYGPPWSPTGGHTRKDASGKTHNPMQGYAYLEQSRLAPTPEMVAARKAQVRALYEQRVLVQT